MTRRTLSLEVIQTCHTETKASCSVHNEKLKMQGKIYPAFPPNTQGTSNCPENTLIDRENLKLWRKDLAKTASQVQSSYTSNNQLSGTIKGQPYNSWLGTIDCQSSNQMLGTIISQPYN
jgi:hypothetical protein